MAVVANPIVQSFKFQVESSKSEAKAFNFELGTWNSIEDSLAHVTLRAVREERDDALACAESFGDTPRCGCRRAGRASAENAFGAREFAHRGEGFGVCDGDDLVGQRAVEVRRDELALSDAFETVEARLAASENRADRLDKSAVDIGVNFFYRARDSGERTGGATAKDNGVNAPVHLFDDLAR